MSPEGGRVDMNRTLWVWGALTATALACGFAWFDFPSSSAVLAGHAGLLGPGAIDGHTLFLLGMLASVALQLIVPRLIERRLSLALLLCLVLGVLSLGAYCFAPSAAISSAAVVLTGFACVMYLDCVLAVVLTNRCEWRGQVLLLSVSLSAKTLLVYFGTSILGEAGQKALLVSLPIVGVACAFGAVAFSRRLLDSDGARGVIFDKPLSTVMLGMLLVTGVLFATMRVVRSLGFWGSGYPLLLWGPVTTVLAIALYLLVCYATLVRVGSSLLVRFLPALLLLFALYTLLHSGLGSALGLSETTMLCVSQLAELYGHTFTLCVILFAIRTLRIPALRTMGLNLVVYTLFELGLQRYVVSSDSAGLVAVLLCFFAVFAGLIGVLCYFNGGSASAKSGLVLDESGPTKSERATDEVPGVDCRRALAMRHGLSGRETDVFLMLAQGRSRKFICDELFIADGTASTYIGRVYEKFGVHSKQELIALVLEEESGAGVI